MSWTELMKQAEHCGLASMPTLNQTGAVERHLLVDEQVRQLGLEGVEVLRGREVALGLRPGGDRVDDPVDELLDARLALGRADVAAEVLAHHDVGRELAPERGDFHVLLLEDGLAALVADVGEAGLPDDLVVRVDALAGPAPLDRQATGRGGVRGGAIEAGPVGPGMPACGRGVRRVRGGVLGGRLHLRLHLCLRVCRACRAFLGPQSAIHDGDGVTNGSNHSCAPIDRVPVSGVPACSVSRASSVAACLGVGVGRVSVLFAPCLPTALLVSLRRHRDLAPLTRVRAGRRGR